MYPFGSEKDGDFVERLGYGILFAAFPTFYLCQNLITAPFGKHAPSSLDNNTTTGMWLFRAQCNARLSWFLFEIPNLVWSFVAYRNRREDVFATANAILLGLFVLHYVNRAIIYPLRMSSHSRPVPLFITFSAFIFTNFNGYLQGHDLCQYQTFAEGHHTSFHFLCSILIFWLGLGINLNADSILRSLREEGKGYRIPRGGMFEYVSGANHFGECLEWLGFTLASGLSIPSLAFFAYTCGNLIPRAVSHHMWYKEKFDEYPRDRKAVIPFLY